MDPEMLFEMSASGLDDVKPLKDIYDLSGKVAVLSGSTGLALYTTQRLLQCGASVVIGDYNEDMAKMAVNAMKERGFEKVACKKTDVRSSDDDKALVAFAEETFGPIDIVVPIAGIWQSRAFLDMDEELYDKIVDTDLKGEYFLVQAAARSMVANKRKGKIVTIASPAYRGEDTWKMAMMTPYNAAKAGVIGMTLGICKELKQYDINVNCVCPGAMVSPGSIMNNSAASKFYGPEYDKDLLTGGSAVPVSNSPDEVALVILAMCTPISDFMYGALIEVTGGAGLSWQEKPWSFTMGEGFLSAETSA